MQPTRLSRFRRSLKFLFFLAAAAPAPHASFGQPNGTEPPANPAIAETGVDDEQRIREAVDVMLRDRLTAAAFESKALSLQLTVLNRLEGAILNARMRKNPVPKAEEVDRLALNLLAFRYESLRRAPADFASFVAVEGERDQRKQADRFLQSVAKNETFPRLSPKAHETAIALYVATLRENLRRRLELIEPKPESFAQFTERIVELETSAAHSVSVKATQPSVVYGCVAEMAQGWVTAFDRLPSERQLPSDAHKALEQITRVTDAAAAKSFEPLWKRLESNSHPLLALFGLRARSLNGWRGDLQPDERVERFHRFMNAAVSAIETERKADHKSNLFYLQIAMSAFADDTAAPIVPEVETAKMDFAEGRGKVVLGAFSMTGLFNPWDEASGRRALKIIHDIDPNLLVQPYRLHTNRIITRFPNLRDPKDLEAAPDSRLLFDALESGGRDSLRFVHVRGERAYGVLLHPMGKSVEVRLTSIDLSKGGAAVLSKYELPGGLQGLQDFNKYGIAPSCLANDAYYLTGKSLGVVRFDLETKEAKLLIAPQKGDAAPLSILSVGDHLYVGTEQGKLFRHDLKTGERTSIALPEPTPDPRRNKNASPIVARRLLHDAERDRILIVAQHAVPGVDLDSRVLAYRLKSGDVETLIPFGGPFGGQAEAKLIGDELWINGSWLFRWNLKTDAKELIDYVPWGDLPSTLKLTFGMTWPIPCAGTVWWLTESELYEKDPSVTIGYRRHFNPPEDPPKHDRSGLQYLVPVDEKRFLFYDRQQLFEVTPKVRTK